MTTAARANFVKVLPPRALTDKETTHSLTQWKINFKQYCKKDDLYRHFLLATTEWDATEANYGFTDNVGARTPAICIGGRGARFLIYADELYAAWVYNRQSFKKITVI